MDDFSVQGCLNENSLSKLQCLRKRIWELWFDLIWSFLVWFMLPSSLPDHWKTVCGIACSHAWLFARHGKEGKKNKAAVFDLERLTLDGMLVVIMFADNSCLQQNLFLHRGMLGLVECLRQACCVWNYFAAVVTLNCRIKRKSLFKCVCLEFFMQVVICIYSSCDFLSREKIKSDRVCFLSACISVVQEKYLSVYNVSSKCKWLS